MPDGWRRTTLSHVCADGGFIQTGPFGSQLHARDYVADGVPVVMPVNIGGGKIDESSIARISEEDATRLSRHRVRVGDIVYARRGDITRCARIGESQAGWLCGTGCLLVRPGNAVRSRWLMYWLGCPWTHEYLLRRAVGATMPNLNTGILSSLPVDLPPLDVQRRIAGVLGNLDDLIDANRRLISDLSATLSAAFLVAQRSFTGAAVPIGEVLEIVGGSTPSTSVERYWGGGISWATPKDLSGASSAPLLSTGRTLSEEGLEQVSSGLLAPGTVLLSSRAPIGYLAIAEVPVAVNQGFIAIRESDRLPSLFVLEWLRANMDVVESRAGGTTFKEISRAAFRPIPIDMPSSPVIAQFCAVAEPCYRAIVELEQESAQIRSARDELLPLLMSGRVTPGEVA